MLHSSRAVTFACLAIFSLLCACAPGPAHFVDENGLSAFKGRPTSVGKISVPCGLRGSFILGGAFLKEQQLGMLSNMHPNDVVQVMADAYGLEPAADPELEIKWRLWDPLMALISQSRGRCFYEENPLLKPGDNVVDIELHARSSCPLTTGCSVSLLYDIVVRQGEKIFIRHRDEFSSIKYRMFIGDDEINEMIASAAKISDALKRDIPEKGKAVPNEKN